MHVYCDTSAILALINKDEENHEAAVSYRDGLADSVRLVLSTDVFDETITRARKRIGHGAMVALGRALLEGALGAVVPVEGGDRDHAWRLFEQRDTLRLSFTDCTSAAVMERLGIKTVFTFDDDFRKLGFTVVP